MKDTEKQLISSAQNQSSLISKYGNKDNFLSLFHVAKQIQYTNIAERCYFGSAPSLREVNDCYGKGSAEEFLTYQFIDLIEYCGVKDKLNENQLVQLSMLVAEDYKYLSVTEIMLFCRQFKSAKFGRFYGSVDPMVISEALLKFSAERKKIRSKKIMTDESERIKQIEQIEEAITYDEYLRRKNKEK